MVAALKNTLTSGVYNRSDPIASQLLEKLLAQLLEYCLLSEDGTPVRKNPQQKPVFRTFASPLHPQQGLLGPYLRHCSTTRGNGVLCTKENGSKINLRN